MLYESDVIVKLKVVFDILGLVTVPVCDLK